jgi:glucan phosphoethanolaminetransferase (alkaline phosphatase superfamily)
MADIDPSKVVAVFEYLLGPRLGKVTATAVLTSISLFILFWCFSGIWENGGRQLLDSLLGLGIPAINEGAASVATFLLILIFYGVVMVAILFFVGERLFRKSVSQFALDGLAALRNEGLDTVYSVRVSNKEELESWKRTKSDWEHKVRAYIQKNFPKADYLFASHMGPVALQQVNAFDPERLRESN